MTTRNYTTEWNAKNPKKKTANDRSRHLKNAFGEAMMEQIGFEGQDGYDFLLEQQDHKCKFCGVHEDDCKSPLEVDHCHEKSIYAKFNNKGFVRGLVCSGCNTALGGFENVLAMGEEKILDYFQIERLI